MQCAERPFLSPIQKFNAFLDRFSLPWWRTVNLSITASTIVLAVLSKVVWENDTSIHGYIRAWVNTLLPNFTYSLLANGAAIVLGALWRAFTLRGKEHEQERHYWEMVVHKIWLASFSGIYLFSWLHVAMGHDSWSHF